MQEPQRQRVITAFHGLPNCIHVSQATYELLQDKYYFEERGTIQVKGKGEMLTYLLKGRKAPEN